MRPGHTLTLVLLKQVRPSLATRIALVMEKKLMSRKRKIIVRSSHLQLNMKHPRYQSRLVLTHLIIICSGIILEKVEKDGTLDSIHSDLQEEEISLGAACWALRELSQRD